MRITIELLVAAIVILIVALVVLTMFGFGVRTVSSITEAENICKQNAAAACATMIGVEEEQDLPSNVLTYKIRVGNKVVECGEFLNGCKCEGGRLINC